MCLFFVRKEDSSLLTGKDKDSTVVYKRGGGSVAVVLVETLMLEALSVLCR